MFAYCLNNPVTGYDPTGMVNAEGLAVGLALIGLGALLIAATVLTAGAASPLVATLGTAACSAVGYAALQTGTVVATAAYEETPIVIDVTATNGHTHNRDGYSYVIDFETCTIETYYHHGVTTSSNYGYTYGVGHVFNYDGPEDYGGHFVDAGGSFTYNGIDYGVDICTDPTRLGDNGATAILATVGVSFPTTPKPFPLSGGYDYYVPVSYISWR